MKIKKICCGYEKLAFCDECYRHCGERELVKIKPKSSKGSIYLCEKCLKKIYEEALEILSNSVRSENIVAG